MADTLPELGEARTVTPDIGAGDPEAPANAIPNIIAHLVETETWRNAATVITGLLLVALGYWAYHGVHGRSQKRASTSLEALLGTVVKGLDVWVGEHIARKPQRRAANPTRCDAARRRPSPSATVAAF